MLALVFFTDLKRFSETRWSKLTTLVEFPTKESGLNLAPYASSSSSDTTPQYSLYATSNHMGKLDEVLIGLFEHLLANFFRFDTKIEDWQRTVTTILTDLKSGLSCVSWTASTDQMTIF